MGIKNSRGGVIVRHKEYIGDIGPSANFVVDTLEINPGMDICFPWLSQIAMAFQEYKWRGLIFTYKAQCSDLVTGTNPGLGTVIMATDYNAVENRFTDKRSMENYEFTTSSRPSASFVHMVETAKNQTAHPTLFTRDGPPPTGADKRLYDIGAFSIATQGMQATDATATIGELWVSYEIEFLKPRFQSDSGIEDTIGSFTATARTECTTGATFAMFGNPTAGAIVSSAAVTYKGDLGVVLSKGSAGQPARVTFPSDSSGKTFLIQYKIAGTASAGTGTDFVAVLTPTANNCEGIDYYNGLTVGDYWANPGSQLAGTQVVADYMVQIGNVPNQQTLPYVEFAADSYAKNRWPSAISHLFLAVFEVSNNLSVLA